MVVSRLQGGVHQPLDHVDPLLVEAPGEVFGKGEFPETREGISSPLSQSLPEGLRRLSRMSEGQQLTTPFGVVAEAVDIDRACRDLEPISAGDRLDMFGADGFSES